VSQHQCIHTLVERHGLGAAHPVVLPVGVGALLTEDGVPLDELGTTNSQELLGGLRCHLHPTRHLLRGWKAGAPRLCPDPGACVDGEGDA